MVPKLHSYQVPIISFVGAIALSIGGVAIQVSGYENMALAIVLGMLAVILILCAIFLGFIVFRRRRVIILKLAEFIDVGDDLHSRDVKSEDAFNQWKSDYLSWRKNASSWIKEHISSEAEKRVNSITGNLTLNYQGAYQGYFGEHNTLLNELFGLMKNLRQLFDLY